jgi:hypothetical protein
MRATATTSFRGGRRPAATVTLSLLGAALAVAVTIPALQDWAAVLMLGAVAMFATALVLARRSVPQARRVRGL